jgi:hypothetical protein
MRRAALLLTISVGFLLGSGVTYANEKPDSTLETEVQAPARTPLDRPADYDAADPGRDALTHARALANLGFSSWFIWQANWFRGVDWVPVTRDSLSANLRRGFTFDRDELQTNFFGHPVHGGLMFTSGRATGLSFWESAPYAVLGSVNWELFAERETPSANDLAMTTLAGIMLGEITYRLSSAILDDRSSGPMRLMRELGAAAISPMRGFDRMVTGRAWRDGPAGIRHPVDVAVHAGVDRVRAGDGRTTEGHTPSALFAADVVYGDLRPSAFDVPFEPFEFFELYAAANLFNSVLQGGQIYTTALLHGWSADISNDRGSRQDNNVFGLAMTYEFQGANVATYGGVGLGPANYLVFRLGHQRSLRIGAGTDVVPIVGVTPNEPRDGEPNYNFGMGAAAWGIGLLDLARWGKLRVRSRHYIATVLDGNEGGDYLGATRLSYEVDAVEGFGVGLAPTFIQRRSLTDGDDVSSFQVETQIYLRIHN